MALLDNIFGGSGGWLGPQVGTTPDFQQPFPLQGQLPSVSFDWLRQLLSQNGGYASGAPSDVAVAGLQPNTAGPASFNDRFGNLPPAGTAPLPPPVNVPSLKVASEPIPSTPPAAQPIQYQAPQAQTRQPAPSQPSFSDTSSGGLGSGLRGFIANAHTGPIGAILGGVAGLAGMGTGNQQQQAALALFQHLRTKMPEQQAYALAKLGAMNPKLMDELIKGPAVHAVGPGQKLVGVGLGGEASTIAEGGPEKPPAGYDWVDAKNPNKGLKPIPGGPESKLPAQEAGYLAMMEAAKPGVAQAAKFFLDPNFGKNPISAIGQATNSFEIGRQQRNIRYAIEAALRVATGAAAPESEVQRWSDMYMPSVYDNLATRQQKITALQNFMNSATEKMQQGRMPASPNAGWVDVGGGIRIREKK